MDIDLTEIIIAVLTLIAGVVAKFLIPYIKERCGAEQLEKIKVWVKAAVEAAEMIYVGSGRGAEKKAYVLEFLNSKGFTVDFESLDNLIESAVLELKNEKEEAGNSGGQSAAAGTGVIRPQASVKN